MARPLVGGSVTGATDGKGCNGKGWSGMDRCWGGCAALMPIASCRGRLSGVGSRTWALEIGIRRRALREHYSYIDKRTWTRTGAADACHNVFIVHQPSRK